MRKEMIQFFKDRGLFIVAMALGNELSEYYTKGTFSIFHFITYTVIFALVSLIFIWGYRNHKKR